jgi:hypothetical protein
MDEDLIAHSFSELDCLSITKHIKVQYSSAKTGNRKCAGELHATIGGDTKNIPRTVDDKHQI